MKNHTTVNPMFFITITLAVLLLGSTVMSWTPTPTSQQVLAYEKKYTQVESLANDCANGKIAFNVLCQNLASEIQGDRNALNMIGIQTGGEIPVPPDVATLNVVKQVICPEGFVCPAPGDFTINVAGNNPSPNSFLASATGTAVSLGAGAYQVTEVAPTTPPGLVAQPPVFSVGCSGNVVAGQELSCTVTNEFIIAPPDVATLNVVKQVICPEGFVCPAPGDFTINVAGNNPSPNSFLASATGTAVSLGAGAYQVTEVAPTTPPGLVAQPPVFSVGCSGNVVAGQELSCTVTNEFVPICPPDPKMNVVWEGIIDGSIDQDILYGSNADCFATPVDVSRNSEPSLNPRIASIGDNIFVTWQEQGFTALDDEVFFARSIDGGQTFNEPMNISKSPTVGLDGDSDSPDIAAFGSNVYIVWEESSDEVSGGRQVFLSKSTDAGVSFTEPRRITGSEQFFESGTEPSIEVDEDGNVYVAYDTLSARFTPIQNNVAIMKSTDEAENFADPIRLNNDPPVFLAGSSRIATSLDDVDVAWQESSGPAFQEIFFAMSSDEGMTFGTPINVSDSAEQSTLRPDIAALGDNVYVTWTEGTIGNREIFISQSNDGGQTFTEPLSVTQNADFIQPAIDVNEDGIFIVYWGRSSIFEEQEVFLQQSTDGNVFTDPVNISNDLGVSQQPDISLS
jgi:hypothetical protein